VLFDGAHMPIYKILIRDELNMEKKIRLKLKSHKSLPDLKDSILRLFDERNKPVEQPAEPTEDGG